MGTARPTQSIPTGKSFATRFGKTQRHGNILYALPSIHVYVLQKKVFDDVGRGILENAWNGFHTSLFAYGQTGSGKSWSVIGYGPNKGRPGFPKFFSLVD